MKNDPSPATLEPPTGAVSAAVPGYAARATEPSCNGNPGAERLAGGSAEQQWFDAPGVTLILGDCRKMKIEADAVISDPPYGMQWEGNQRFSGGKTRRGKGTKHGMIAHDDEPFDPARWVALTIPVVLWGANHFWNRLRPGAALIWQKRNDHALGTFLSDAEVAYLNRGCGVYVYTKTFAGSSRAVDGGVDPYEGSLHPNQKPVSLMAWCMDKAKVPVGATVLDPYMGSGSTAIACIRTGRKFIGVEIDPGHFTTAVQRVRAELAQGVLFSPSDGAERAGSQAPDDSFASPHNGQSAGSAAQTTEAPKA